MSDQGTGQGDGKSRKFSMKEQMFSIGEDYWIEDDDGNKAYRVDGKALRFRQTFVLEDASGREVATIKERKLSIRDKMGIERDDKTIATVRTAIGWGDRYAIEIEGGGELKAHGKVAKREYKIEREGHKVAEISKKWFRIRDTYGVEIASGEDPGLILAAIVAIEALATDGKDH
jgi:uncharacterized protein YxjI